MNSNDLLSEVNAHLDEGADPSSITKYGETPLRVASNNGRFDVVRLLLDRGADETQLEWSAIFHTLAFGNIHELEELITDGADLEARDFWSRTPFLLSILVGDTEKTEMLYNARANIEAVGHCGKAPVSYAIQNDDVSMLNWLLARAFDPEQKDDHGNTPLIVAAGYGAKKCVKALIDADVDLKAANNIPRKAIEATDDIEIAQILIDAGMDINDLTREARASLLGYEVGEAPDTTLKEYNSGKNRVFGKSNPERANNPFWMAMVKCGGNAYSARSKFDPEGDSFKNGPIWCFDRFGKSITRLPDGRFIEIAGEHEDFYDPDFCIYNDVFVHSGNGDCEIYIYPKKVFPPTDFHSATLVDGHIYIIGNTGYTDERQPGFTPVYRLDIETLKIEAIKTRGDNPGWINSHQADYDDQANIHIQGGSIVIDDNGKQQFIANQNAYCLSLGTMEWTKLYRA